MKTCTPCPCVMLGAVLPISILPPSPHHPFHFHAFSLWMIPFQILFFLILYDLFYFAILNSFFIHILHTLFLFHSSSQWLISFSILHTLPHSISASIHLLTLYAPFSSSVYYIYISSSFLLSLFVLPLLCLCNSFVPLSLSSLHIFLCQCSAFVYSMSSQFSYLSTLS